VATFTQLASGNWRVQVRRKTRYVAETFRRRKDGEEWALDMERNIDRNGSSKPRVVQNVRTFGDLIDLHDEDMCEVGKPPRRSKAAVMASLKTELGSVKLPALNRERLIEFGRKRAKQGAGPATLAIDLSFKDWRQLQRYTPTGKRRLVTAHTHLRHWPPPTADAPKAGFRPIKVLALASKIPSP
jgi:hypothetical protein